MRISTAVVTTAVSCALAVGTVVAAGSASAATPSHLVRAKSDWVKGAHVAAAEQNRWLAAARTQLGTYGHRYVHERAVIRTLEAIPETGTTRHQRTVAARETRELNAFFGTPGLYGVPQGHPKNLARNFWVDSSKVSAARQNAYFAAAKDELMAFGSRYHAAQAQLVSLESIPLTGTTAKQRAVARHDVRALDAFFGTPGINA